MNIQKEPNWFSNFIYYNIPLTYKNISYTSPEHFYQAMKTTDPVIRQSIANSNTGGKAKRLGRKISIRSDWDDITIQVMTVAIAHRKHDNSWIDKLISTNDEIVEWNYWHDNYWGNCICDKCLDIKGLNNLGRIIMNLRTEINMRICVY